MTIGLKVDAHIILCSSGVQIFDACRRALYAAGLQAAQEGCRRAIGIGCLYDAQLHA